MKLGIVTVYQSYNCGSFLQAYALHKVLTDQGHDVGFIKNTFTVEARLWYRLLQGAKYICTGKFKRARHVLRVYNNFRKVRKQQRVISSFKGLDAVIYGSDTIWNIEDTYFLKYWRRFFGDDYSGRKIAYAASIGSTTLQELLEKPQLRDAIASFSTIGIRDMATREFVQACCKEHVPVEAVVDPTMLLPKEAYERLASGVNVDRYIFFYHFGAIAENVKQQVREFADRTGRKIVVFGEDRGWADIYVSNDPFLMLGYYKNADYIITNTFHGNVFSIIFNKQFISFGREKQKVRALLEQFGLGNRLTDTQAQFTSLFEEKIDYHHANERLEALRVQSLAYLHDAVIDKKD